MSYEIEDSNSLNIYFIVIVVTRTPFLIINTAGILVFNSDPDSHFCPGCAEQAQNRILKMSQNKIYLAINPQKITLTELSIPYFMVE